MSELNLIVEGVEVDINQNISTQLTYSIDDVSDFAKRDSSFSKQVILVGTNKTNAALGFISDLANSNTYTIGQANIGANFNVAQTAKAELYYETNLLLKGKLRIVKIIKQKDVAEYEALLFGELGGFITAISNKRLEDLDFSAYNHIYNLTNITASWAAMQGVGYYYTLIDYGTYSSNKIDYDIRAMRPAIYVKEYIDKIFAAAGYTYECDMFNTAWFKSIVIPSNTKELKSVGSRLLEATDTAVAYSFNPSETQIINYENIINNGFSVASNSFFTYTGTVSVPVTLKITFNSSGAIGNQIRIIVYKNSVALQSYFISISSFLVFEINTTMNNGDVFNISLQNTSLSFVNISVFTSKFEILSQAQTLIPIAVGDTIKMNDIVPKGIFQRDFFSSIIKMFNLYITEDKLTPNKLIIKPFKDFYGGSVIDWTDKVARDKSFEIMPMGNLNGRIFEFKYKDDSDFYNDEYKKKFNQTYGSRQFDTGFQFSKDKQTTELIFSGSPLVKYSGTDKNVTAIYKKSKGNSVDQEELTDSNIRIMFTKTLTCNSWIVKDGHLHLGTLGQYGYAGHLNDPQTPTQDLNFGAPLEVYNDPNSYTGNNLFNVYWSPYIAEIADKDSKLLKCYVYLKPIDIVQLDMSKYVFIDGVKFRINKIEDYDPNMNELTKVELLNVINE